MNFKELRELLYWAVDTGKNVEHTAFLHDGNAGRLINAALRDLTDCLHIIRTTNTLTPNVSGVVTLPADFRDPLLVRWGAHRKLTPIDNILFAALDSNVPTQYMMLNRTAMQLYGAPVPPLEPLHIWYQAYPVELVADTDVPVDVPPEHREFLATVYAKAQLAQKFGDFAQHRQLIGWWGVLKKEIRGITAARVNPEMYTGAWKW